MSQTWTFNGYEMVVGLEVHVELATRTKLFSASPNRFGDEPNTNIDPVTLGLPGALPVLNRQAVELAMRLGLALDCRVQRSTFARKNYFYPDMPKAYQISQYDEPICVDGWLDLPGSIRVGIERAHLEEDTGKSTHIGGSGGRIHGSDFSLIDFNRAGVPLVEIVSRPDIRTPDQAKAYVSELRAILVAVGASDAKMEEGSMRVDANVSVRLPGAEFGTRCEIKNVNSVRSVGRAIEYEAQRQVGMLEAGESIRQETRHWDENDGRTHTLRSKEDADDYRYFQEPDLVVVDPDPEWIERVRAGLPVLPAARRARLAEVTGQSTDAEAILVVTDRDQDAYVLAVAEAGGDAGRGARPREGSLRRAGCAPRCPCRRSGQAHAARGRRLAHRHAGQAGARRNRREWRRRCRGDRSSQGIRGDGHQRPRSDGRRRHRRLARRLDEVLRRRGQSDGSAGRCGDEGIEGAGRRQGGHVGARSTPWCRLRHADVEGDRRLGGLNRTTAILRLWGTSI